MWADDDVRTVCDLLTHAGCSDGERVASAGLRHAAARLDADQPRIVDDVELSSIGHVPAAFPADLCAALDTALRGASWIVSERVETAEGRWTIDLIDNSYQPLGRTTVADAFSALCLATGFIEAVAVMAGYGDQEVVTTRRWVNRYGPDDGIAPHEDTTGDFQIMICLDAPPPSYGGTLVLANDATADLQRGDLLIMAHADVRHWTTPLSADTPTPRATATCRYYVADGRLPHSRVLPHTTAGPRARPEASSG
jgi:hypothetical protein